MVVKYRIIPDCSQRTNVIHFLGQARPALNRWSARCKCKKLKAGKAQGPTSVHDVFKLPRACHWPSFANCKLRFRKIFKISCLDPARLVVLIICVRLSLRPVVSLKDPEDSQTERQNGSICVMADQVNVCILFCALAQFLPSAVHRYS